MNGVHFGVHQDQNFSKLNYRFLMKARHVQTTQKKKGIKCLQYTSKKYCNCFCVLLTFRYIQILYGVLVMFVVTFFWWLWSKMSVALWFMEF